MIREAKGSVGVHGGKWHSGEMRGGRQGEDFPEKLKGRAKVF